MGVGPVGQAGGTVGRGKQSKGDIGQFIGGQAGIGVDATEVVEARQAGQGRHRELVRCFDGGVGGFGCRLRVGRIAVACGRCRASESVLVSVWGGWGVGGFCISRGVGVGGVLRRGAGSRSVRGVRSRWGRLGEEEHSQEHGKQGNGEDGEQAAMAGEDGGTAGHGEIDRGRGSRSGQRCWLRFGEEISFGEGLGRGGAVLMGVEEAMCTGGGQSHVDGLGDKGNVLLSRDLAFRAGGGEELEEAVGELLEVGSSQAGEAWAGRGQAVDDGVSLGDGDADAGELVDEGGAFVVVEGAVEVEGGVEALVGAGDEALALELAILMVEESTVFLQAAVVGGTSGGVAEDGGGGFEVLVFETSDGGEEFGTGNVLA